jgi:hypothetical protein
MPGSRKAVKARAEINPTVKTAQINPNTGCLYGMTVIKVNPETPECLPNGAEIISMEHGSKDYPMNEKLGLPRMRGYVTNRSMGQ